MIIHSIVHTVLIRDYIANNEVPPSSDELLDFRLRLQQLMLDTNIVQYHLWYKNEIRAVDYLLKKHYT